MLMTCFEGLSQRHRRILEEVLRELEHAPSTADARAALEARAGAAPPLANPDLQPVAFSVRHATWKTYAYGVWGEVFAWLTFSAGMLLRLAWLGMMGFMVWLTFLSGTGWGGSVFNVLFMGYISFVAGVVSWFLLQERLTRIGHRFQHERWAARRRRRNPYKKLCADRRAPILYLRSFSFDPVYGLPPGITMTADESLAEYYERYGPVIALAGPYDKGPMPGPARLYFDDDVWRAAVIYLMSISQLVIIQAGISHGTLWEVGLARRRLEPGRLIISLEDPAASNSADGLYRDFKPYAEVILGCELPRSIDHSLQITFGKDWKPLNRAHPLA